MHRLNRYFVVVIKKYESFSVWFLEENKKNLSLWYSLKINSKKEKIIS